ncbi:MAG: class I SAM-dependent methyltransferase [Thermoanaerobaculia bacterium]
MPSGSRGRWAHDELTEPARWAQVSVAGRVRKQLNRVLRPLGVRIESLAAEKAESSRLAELVRVGQFDRPILPLLDSFEHLDPATTFAAVRRYADETSRFAATDGRTGYAFENDYFTSPDAEVAYAMAREIRPGRIVEVGSGNSTRLFRAAILDGDLETELISIDPAPRTEVASIADRVLRKRLEEVDEAELVGWFEAGDFLFIDSSHRIEAGNDVVSLLLRIVPKLKAGVIVHLHDIFLPFEYPREWLVEFGWLWNEQYLVQAMLQGPGSFGVLWAGHYLQRTIPEFASHFASPVVGRGSSLWLRTEQRA